MKSSQIRAEGMKRTEAGEEAWRRLAVEYPPLPVAAAEELPADDGTTEVVEPSTGLPPYPESWGVIPESAPFDVEVEWVHQNRVLVVDERSGGASRIHWERARKPAPSYGALGLMEFAATNRKGFMDILQRTKPALKEDDEENTRREKKSITEINGILKQIQERCDEELLANVSKAVQDRVRAVLTEYGVGNTA